MIVRTSLMIDKFTSKSNGDLSLFPKFLQYPTIFTNIYHKYCSPRFGIYLSKCKSSTSSDMFDLFVNWKWRDIRIKQEKVLLLLYYCCVELLQEVNWVGSLGNFTVRNPYANSIQIYLILIPQFGNVEPNRYIKNEK